jgi:hypothetical protein
MPGLVHEGTTHGKKMPPPVHVGNPSTTIALYGHYAQEDLERAMESLARARREDAAEDER